MGLQALGTRFHEARVAGGLSESTVSERLGITEADIQAIESGIRGLSANELIEASKFFRRPLKFFTEAEVPMPSQPFSVLFRTLQPAPVDYEALFEFETLCRSFTWLEQVLQIERTVQPHRYQFSVPQSMQEAEVQGEELANEERKRLDLGLDPVRDPFQILESQGIRIFVRPLKTENYTGFFHSDAELGCCILLNSKLHVHRRAFDLLHEYAHVLVDRPQEETHQVHDKHDDHDPIERRAEAFAAAFLIPRLGAERFFADQNVAADSIGVSDAFRLMVTSGASFRATVNRLRQLGYWSPKQAKIALSTKEITRTAERYRLASSIDPVDFDSPLNRRFSQLALRAYSRSEISIGKLAELLEVDISEARRFARLSDQKFEPEADSPDR